MNRIYVEILFSSERVEKHELQLRKLSPLVYHYSITKTALAEFLEEFDSSTRALEDMSLCSCAAKYDIRRVVLCFSWIIRVHLSPDNILYNDSRNLVSRWTKGT